MVKNYLLEHNLPEEQKRINRQLEQSYAEILAFIKRMSATLDQENLRIRIENDHKQNPETVSTIHECVTPYCIVSLGADETGYYSIAYSIDYRANEIIGDYALSYLVRGINRLTMIGYTAESIEHRVRVHSLATDIVSLYNNMLDEGENEYRRILKEDQRNS